jgi:hypothetical protein
MISSHIALAVLPPPLGRTSSRRQRRAYASLAFIASVIGIEKGLAEWS